MQLVIDIDDELYEIIKNPKKLEMMYHAGKLCEAVRKGTPLPKGHGKIIDATFALEAKITKDNIGVSERSKGWNEACQAIYENAPSIIEVDTPKRRKGTPLEENDSGYNCENWIP